MGVRGEGASRLSFTINPTLLRMLYYRFARKENAAWSTISILSQVTGELMGKSTNQRQLPTSLSKTRPSTVALGCGFDVRSKQCPKQALSPGDSGTDFEIVCSTDCGFQSSAWNSFRDCVPRFAWGWAPVPTDGQFKSWVLHGLSSQPQISFGSFGWPSLTWSCQTPKAAVI